MIDESCVNRIKKIKLNEKLEKIETNDDKNQNDILKSLYFNRIK